MQAVIGALASKKGEDGTLPPGAAGSKKSKKKRQREAGEGTLQQPDAATADLSGVVPEPEAAEEPAPAAAGQVY